MNATTVPRQPGPIREHANTVYKPRRVSKVVEYCHMQTNANPGIYFALTGQTRHKGTK